MKGWDRALAGDDTGLQSKPQDLLSAAFAEKGILMKSGHFPNKFFVPPLCMVLIFIAELLDFLENQTCVCMSGVC